MVEYFLQSVNVTKPYLSARRVSEGEETAVSPDD